MEMFMKRHAPKGTAVLSCFDRVLFKGYLPFVHAQGMANFLDSQRVLYKDFKSFVLRQAEILKTHSQTQAQRAGRPWMYLNGYVRKEDLVQKILQEQPVSSGLVCTLAAVEPCQSFVLRSGIGRPQLVAATRRCLTLYWYFLDPEFGLLHVRVQTWFPLTVQVCMNGHEWLARKLDRHGVGYQKIDNAFTQLDDAARTQRFADRFAHKQWPRILNRLAGLVNPLLRTLLKDYSYYWVVDQAEFATDVIFPDRHALGPLYDRLLQHATLCFSAEDVLTFLGRKLHGRFQGEVHNDLKKRRRLPGTRIKHRMSRNWIKMYDKFGHVLRVETVINQPREFRVRRRVTRNGRRVSCWVPMIKGVRHFFRYYQVALAANRRYLDALAVVEDPSAAYASLNRMTQPTTRQGRSYRGLNPLREDDLRLFAAVLRGEHAMHGFRSADLLSDLHPKIPTDASRSSVRAKVTRRLQILRAHGLLAKVPRSHRYRLTSEGVRLMAAAVWLRRELFPELIGRLRMTA
jgi:hypothetical protein